MKLRELKIMLFLVLGMGFSSCFQDKGNYDYDALNRVGVQLPFEQGTVARGEYLDVFPDMQLNGDTMGYSGRYEYLWELLPKTTDMKYWKLAETKNLYYLMDIPVGNYLLVYSVKDKETGLTWKTSAALDVKSEINQGWLLMTEVMEGGKVMADLDICSQNLSDGTYKVYKGLLKSSGFPYREGPRSVTLRSTFPGGEVDGVGRKIKRIYTLTDQACGWLDYQTQMWKDDQLIRYQMLEPQGDNFTVKKVACLDLAKVFAFTEDGGVMTLNSMTGGAVFGEKINFLSENGELIEFKVAPYLGGSMADGLASLYPYILFDETHQQFVRCEFNPYSSNNAGCYRIPADWAKAAGMTMRYMQSCGKQGVIYALLQESPGKFKQYRLSVANGISSDAPTIVDAPHLTANSLVAYHQLYGYLYYTDGNNLYTYRSDKGEVLAKPMNAPITALAAIHFSTTDMDINKYIAVATYDATKGEQGGVLTLLMPEASKPESMSTVETFKKTGKVVSIDYLY